CSEQRRGSASDGHRAEVEERGERRAGRGPAGRIGGGDAAGRGRRRPAGRSGPVRGQGRGPAGAPELWPVARCAGADAAGEVEQHHARRGDDGPL
uniref:Transcriptional regulator, AsnC family n=1 Tax=Parastrongyloides trichosuri TaxID=131310 RepID=A0A0N5A023_PARTI